MLQQFRNFLYSKRNIVGSLLALGGLALYFVGLIPGLLWIPIVIALYLAGVLLVPAERGLGMKLDAQRETVNLRDTLDRLLIGIRGRVADDIYEKVANIRRSILATAQWETAGDATDPNVFLIHQTALDYLPGALAAYLKVPRAYAETRPVQGTQTAHDVLLEQLQLMDAKMTEIANDLSRHDTDMLLSHGRFLAERFGSNSLDVDRAMSIPAATATLASMGVVPPGGGQVAMTAEPSAPGADVGAPANVPAAAATTVPESEQAAAIERERVH